MQIKSTMRYHLTPIRMSIIKKRQECQCLLFSISSTMFLIVEGNRRRESAQQQDWLVGHQHMKAELMSVALERLWVLLFPFASPACLLQGQSFPEAVIKEGLQKLIFFSLQFSFQTGVKISYTITTNWLNTIVWFYMHYLIQRLQETYEAGTNILIL